MKYSKSYDVVWKEGKAGGYFVGAGSRLSDLFRELFGNYDTGACVMGDVLHGTEFKVTVSIEEVE